MGSRLPASFAAIRHRADLAAIACLAFGWCGLESPLTAARTFDTEAFHPIKWQLKSGQSGRKEARARLKAMPTAGQALVIDARIDPVVDQAGNLQVVADLILGVGTDGNTDPGKPDPPRIVARLRDSGEWGSWALYLDGKNITNEPPDKGNCDSREFQKPFVFGAEPGPYHIRVVVIPEEPGSRVRLHVNDVFRAVEGHRIGGPPLSAECALAALIGGKDESAVAVIDGFSAKIVPAEEALAPLRPADAVMAALNRDHPALREAARHLAGGNRETAEKALLHHLRTRLEPAGPPLEDPVIFGTNFKEIADEALEGRYGTQGFGVGFSDQFADRDGTIRWDLDNGHLNRHFHWCSLAKAFEQTRSRRYAERFAREVRDWVMREPFFRPKNPDVGGLDSMDGTVFKLGWMNTSNIGRRCELTWWPAFETFRKSEDFDDDAFFAMLLGFIRQSRLLMNPTSFAWWDDGGAHGTVALLQNALMLPEFTERTAWLRVAEKRLEEVARRQFYPDGAHVSLSTGYNFASIKALEHAIELYSRCDTVPPAFLNDRLRDAYRHPALIARPANRGQIDLNDGGWGPVDDHLQKAARLFPEDKALQWFATSGRKGSPPEERSILFPWAGHAVLRTGWGPEDLYLFMDCGPIGMSHAKEDKLTVFIDRGGTVLLGSGGRASYGDREAGSYTGSIFAQNTISVDDMNHARIPSRYEHEIKDPEKRRFATSDGFDFAEGFHTHGWFSPNVAVKGRHTRQVILVKGERPPETAFFVVLDQVDFADEKEHLVEALWHPTRNETKFGADGLTADSVDAGGALRIQPLIRHGLTARLVTGQTEPHLQGWTIAGPHKKATPCVIHRWNAHGSTLRAWLLLPAEKPKDWPIAKFETAGDHSGWKIRLHRNDDGTCEIEWRPGSLRIQEMSRLGATTFRFEMPAETNTP